MKIFILILAIIGCSNTNYQVNEIICYRTFYHYKFDFDKYGYHQTIVLNDSTKLYSTLYQNKLLIFDLDSFKLIKTVEDTLQNVKKYTIKSLNEIVLQNDFGFLVINKDKNKKYISKNSLKDGIHIVPRYDFNYDFNKDIFIVRVINYNKRLSNGNAFSGLVLWNGFDYYQELDLIWDDYFIDKNRLFNENFFIEVYPDEYIISCSHSNRFFILNPEKPFEIVMKEPTFSYNTIGFETSESSDAMELFAIRSHNNDFKHSFSPVVKLIIDSIPYFARLYFHNVDMNVYIKMQTSRQALEIHLINSNMKIQKTFEPGILYGNRTQLYSYKNSIGFTENIRFTNDPFNKNFRVLRMYNFVAKSE